MWFISKYKERILELEESNKFFSNEVLEISQRLSSKFEKEKTILKDRINFLEWGENREERQAALMRQSLGMDIDFSAADVKCLPPHYLDSLDEEARKNFITHMESIHSDSRFQQVVKYMINLFALNMVFKEDDKEKLMNQGAVVGFRTFLKKLDGMHTEFLSYRKTEEEFDDQDILPE